MPHADTAERRLDGPRLLPPAAIMVVTDLSQNGGHAIERAALLAAGHRADLTLLHLGDRGRAAPPDAGVRLAQHAKQLRRRLQLPVHALPQPARRLDDVAAAAGAADLIVWGTAPPQGLRECFGVHPAVRLLRLRPRPVLVVGRPAPRPYGKVMVGVDFSEASRTVVAAALALDPQARVELFHAIDGSLEGKLTYAQASEDALRAYRRDSRLQAQARMMVLIDSCDTRRNRVSSWVGRGDPARQLLVQQQTHGADLLVAGKRRATALADLLFDSVAQRLLRETRSDVLLVPLEPRPAARAAGTGAQAAMRCS